MVDFQLGDPEEGHTKQQTNLFRVSTAGKWSRRE